MIRVHRPTVKQGIFYGFVFISGFIYQPMWVYNNFWFKAEFYDSIPFKVPFFFYQSVYAVALTAFYWLVVKLVKKHL